MSETESESTLQSIIDAESQRLEAQTWGTEMGATAERIGSFLNRRMAAVALAEVQDSDFDDLQDAYETAA